MVTTLRSVWVCGGLVALAALPWLPSPVVVALQVLAAAVLTIAIVIEAFDRIPTRDLLALVRFGLVFLAVCLIGGAIWQCQKISLTESDGIFAWMRILALLLCAVASLLLAFEPEPGGSNRPLFRISVKSLGWIGGLLFLVSVAKVGHVYLGGLVPSFFSVVKQHRTRRGMKRGPPATDGVTGWVRRTKDRCRGLNEGFLLENVWLSLATARQRRKFRAKLDALASSTLSPSERYERLIAICLASPRLAIAWFVAESAATSREDWDRVSLIRGQARRAGLAIPTKAMPLEELSHRFGRDWRDVLTPEDLRSLLANRPGEGSVLSGADRDEVAHLQKVFALVEFPRSD